MKTVTLLDGDWQAVCSALQDRLHTLRDIGGEGAAIERVRTRNALTVVSRQLARDKGRAAA